MTVDVVLMFKVVNDGPYFSPILKKLSDVFTVGFLS